MADDAVPAPVPWPLRPLLLLAALDSLLAGSWVVLQPTDLFNWLDLTPTRDGLLLSRAVGALTLTHVPCLLLAALRPRFWSGLTAVPLIGRTLLAGVWLWLLNSERIHPATVALQRLLAHDLVWLPLFVVVLVSAARSVEHA